MKIVFVALAAVALAIGIVPARAQTTIAIGSEAPIGKIQPEVYGQFLEHLGAQLYGGLWVGGDSPIPPTASARTCSPRSTPSTFQ